MFSFVRSTLFAPTLFLFLQLTVPAKNSQAPTNGSGLADANRLYRAGKFADAEYSYEVLLQTDSKLVPAQVGLVRALLGQQNVDVALETVNAALAAQPNSASLLSAKGDVLFRGGEMAEAELSYLAAQKLDPKEVRAHLGLAMLYASYSMYLRAYEHVQIAHHIAPDDAEVQVAWLSTLARKERLAAIESYLGSPHPDQEEETKLMTVYLESLKASANQSHHACRLVSKVEQTETKLEGVYTNRHRMRGIALSTKVNNRDVLLQVDTGASGIVVDRNFAEKAGLARVSAVYFRGIGDQGPQSGYRAVANRIRIGELEFEDCVVRVTDDAEIAGLIGTDVFEKYLIDLDLPGMRLKLSPLPKRPEDSVAPTSLSSEEVEPNVEPEENSASEQTPKEQKLSSAKSALPRDRYVAPEMAKWTQVFRFGHNILVQTSVNDSKPMLFLLDTGSPSNVLSERAGRQLSKVRSQDRVRIKGMSGAVNRVYTSAEATLRFGHLQQKNKDIVTLDLSTMNRQDNMMEVSGLLGFSMLKLLEVKLDYRDGLVDFEYDPKHKK